MHRNQRWAKQPTGKRANFIYKGDLCYFEKPAEAYLAEQNFDYSTQLLRVIWPGEPLTYVKRMSTSSGDWLHCFESHGMPYVYPGSIKNFTKERVPYNEE